jgi:hypothetical protein
MNKTMRYKLILIILAIMILFPIIINMMMNVSVLPSLFPVVGDETVWIALLGTFWGAIIGGVIAGVLTLYGVNRTIEASFLAIKENDIQQNSLRKKELEINMAKERLKELYQPTESLISKYIYKYGAHNFEDLNDEEKIELIYLLDRNKLYADSELDQKILEIKWASRSKIPDIESANNLYSEIGDLIDAEIITLREKLGLPQQRQYSVELTTDEISE